MTGTGRLYFYNEEPGEEIEEFEVEIDFTYSYDPGRMYMSNGDPGYPPEETADITRIYDKDKIPKWITDDMIADAFDDQLSDLLDDCEPDYED